MVPWRALTLAAFAFARKPTLQDLSFYMYTRRAIDQSWLARCAGFEELRNSAEGEGMQEANLYSALRNHPYRTRNSSAASLFYIPLFEYSSFRLGVCNGTDHAQRMADAYAALRRMPPFVRSLGSDHFWASSMAIELSYVPLGRPPPGSEKRYIDKRTPLPGHRLAGVRLQERITGKLAKLLVNTTVGRMKHFYRWFPGTPRHPVPRHSSIGRCIIDMGHSPNQVALRLFAPGAPRPTFVFFAGGLDVCCTGQKVRCAVGQLLGREGVVIDVGLRGDTIRGGINESALPCTMRALRSLAARRGVPVRDVLDELVRKGGQDEARSGTYERMGRSMASAVFCLCPAGDTMTTSRFISAIAAGCIPIVPWEFFDGPFGRTYGAHLHKVPYDAFSIKYSAQAFTQSPTGLLDKLRAMSPTKIAARQAALRAHRHHVLLQLPNAVAATHFLEEVADCVDIYRPRPNRKPRARRRCATPPAARRQSLAAEPASDAGARHGSLLAVPMHWICRGDERAPRSRVSAAGGASAPPAEPAPRWTRAADAAEPAAAAVAAPAAAPPAADEAPRGPPRSFAEARARLLAGGALGGGADVGGALGALEREHARHVRGRQCTRSARHSM